MNPSERLRTIEDRLERIEAALGIEAPSEATKAGQVTSATTPVVLSPAESVAERRTASPGPPARRLPAHIGSTNLAAKREESKKREGLSFEQLLGGRVFAGAGALIAVLSVTFFVKLAWDMGWVTLSPFGRCLAAWVFGLVMLAGAEVAHRRLGAFAAIGLNIAGLATLYITSFVALALYDLISVPLTFGLLAATGALGIAISLRARYVIVAGISLAASYVAPFLLRGHAEPTPIVVPVYCLGLLAMALVLSSIRALPFRRLRVAAWLLHLPVAGIWTLVSFSDEPVLALGVIGVTWALINADLLVLSARSTSFDERPDEAGVRFRAALWQNVSFAALFATSLWTLGFGLIVMAEFSPDLDWLVPAGGFVASLIIAQIFHGTLASLRDEPSNPLERFAIAHLAQAGALGIVAVALATADWLSVVCWLALAVGAACTRRYARAKRLAPFVYITLGLGLLHTLTLLPFTAANVVPHVELGGLFLTRGSLLLALCAVAWIAVGALERSREVALVHSAIGCVCLGLAVINSRTPPEWTAGAWLAIALGIALSQTIARRLPLVRLALAALVPVTAMWVYGYLIADNWLRSAVPIGLHSGFLMSLVLVAALWALAYVNRRRGDCASPEARLYWIIGPVGVGAIFLLLTTSLEVVRAADLYAESEQIQRAALSIWWAVFAVPVLVLGFVKKIAPARVAALLLIVLASVKALAYDLFQVEAPLRVALFLALGLLMMALALVYARATARSRIPEPPLEPMETDTPKTDESR